MKPIIICGYSNTGKTSFIERLIKSIKSKGKTVAVIKHIDISHKPKLDDSDTSRYLKAGAELSIGFGGDYLLRYEKNIEKKAKENNSMRYRIHNLLLSANKDFVIIEGLKSYNGPIPKIVFVNSKEEIDSLADELTIGYSGQNAEDFNISIPYIHFNADDETLYRFIDKNSIPFVADLDCGECGYPTCRDFAKALMRKEVTLKNCIPMSGDVKLTVNNKPVFLKGFVRDILRDIVIGFAKNLHDYEEGNIKISIRRPGLD